MKIDTTSPRIPLHRLKHPVKPKISEPNVTAENVIEKTDEAELPDEFEREVIKDGARKFRKWLDELEIK